MKCEELSINALILDMDGVLWRGDTPMPGFQEFFGFLDEAQLGYVLATNNATKTAEMYEEKINGFGVQIPAKYILNSAEATARYLRHNYPDSRLAYVVGEEGLLNALRDQKFSIINSDGFIGDSAEADVVVVGFSRYVTYPQLASAAYLINGGAQFIGTNPDVTIPTEFGPLPGAGSLLAYIKTATGRDPIVIGKPNLPLFEEALKALNSTPETTAMVGDRLATDIAGGQSAGLKTILLLSGITKREDLIDSPVQPDCVLEDLSALKDFLSAAAE
jgi:4-nitrophenyl phosphatase